MIRTSDPKIRNLVLYPAELRARHDCYNHEIAPAQELNLKKTIKEPESFVWEHHQYHLVQWFGM